jgi:hypothetical protein
MRFPIATQCDPAIDAWMHEFPDALRVIAQRWFEVMRNCGKDVRELLHDGHPTACVGDAAFGYVDVFAAHVNIGFFRGAELADPKKLLQGSGKSMRHVKLKLGEDVNEAALKRLVESAYKDMRARVNS